MWFQDTEANILASSPLVPNRIGFATDTGRWFVSNQAASAWQRTTLTPRGAYSAGTTYQKFDLVTSSSKAWLALQQTVGNTPAEGANWTLFVDQGTAGPTGATGPQGISSFTATTAGFTQPGSGATVSVSVGTTAWMASGQAIYMVGGGYYTVSSITNSTTVVLNNTGVSGNASPGATVSSPAVVSPAGPQGTTGATGPTGPSGSSGWKDPVRVASTANVNVTTGGLLTIDGIALSASDRVLLKDQTTASENGIYSAASGAWSRASDANTSALMLPGFGVRVVQGTVNAGRLYALTTTGTITLGTTSLTFGQKPQWGEIGSVPTTFAPSAHAASHAAGGSDYVAKYANFEFFASGDISVPKTGVGHELCTVACTVSAIYMVADTAPAGGTLIATVLKEAGGPGGTTTTVGTVTLSVSSRGTASTTGLSVTLASGDCLRCDLSGGTGYTAASAKNVTVKVLATN